MGLDPLVRSREVHGDGQARLVSERLHQLLHQLHVAVRSFDEKLRLPLRQRTAFEETDGPGPFGRLHGQVAVESERLSVESRGHHRQNDRRRADERHDADAAAVARPDDRRPGIRHARHARLGDHPRRAAFEQRRDQLLDFAAGRGVLVQFAEFQFADGPRDAGFRQETPRRAGVLDDEVVQRIHHGPVGRRQHVPRRRFVRNRTGNQV